MWRLPCHPSRVCPPCGLRAFLHDRPLSRRIMGILCCIVIGALCILFNFTMVKRRIMMILSYHAFSFQHIRLVDALPNGSLVFRSGLPLNTSWLFPLQFDEHRLRAVLRRAVEDPALHVGPAITSAVNTTWSMDSWPLVDVPLLTAELAAIEAEKAFFHTKAPPNELIRYPTHGLWPVNLGPMCAHTQCASLQPRDFTPKRRRRLAETYPEWDPDHSVARIQEFSHMVTSGPPRLYFFHCICGCDRTGSFFIQYSLTRDPTLSFTDLLMSSIATSNRSLFYQYQVSAQWYCEHLAARGIYKGNDCGACDNGLFRCTNTGIPYDLLFYDTLVQVLLCTVILMLFSATSVVCLTCRRAGIRRTPLDEPFLG
eukprot:GEMP01009644.1.p1 GENE.GEMP01009644.1~~GEMP01009644.1.p1  ORF type:complete len:369 (+),score=71.03 GEMP01009644.1:628-1734(+)